MSSTAAGTMMVRTGTQVLPVDTFPQGNTLIGTEETAALVKESGVDAVIIGNAA